MKVIDREQSDASRLLLGLQGFEVEHSETLEATSEGRPRIKLIRLEDTRRGHLCPCGSRSHRVAFDEAEDRWFRDNSVGDYETYIVVTPKRLRCGTRTRVEVYPWAAPGRHRMTRRFFDRVAALARRMPVSEVAELAGLSWETVARVDADATRLALGGERPDIGRPRWIGVDEVSRNGKHNYWTVVTNLETGRVIYLGDGKREESLAGFFAQLAPKDLRRIRGVVSDLGGGFLNAIRRFIPSARHVLDRFHIVQWANEALNAIRRSVFGGAPRDEIGRALKLKKWVLLSRGENLKPEQQSLLEKLRSVNAPLYDAYLLKERLRALLREPVDNPESAREPLLAWCREALAAEPPMAKVARVLSAHVDKVLAGFDVNVRLGLVEAINGKIGLLRRQARGYRDPEYFKLKIYQRCSLPPDAYVPIVL